MTKQNRLLTPEEMKLVIGDRMIAGRTRLETARKLCEAQRGMTLREVGEQLGDVLRDFSGQNRQPGHPTSYWAGYHYARNLLQHYIKALKQGKLGE